MIEHLCPECGKFITSADSLAGLRRACPHCRTSVLVPETTDAAARGRSSEYHESAAPATAFPPSAQSADRQGQCPLCNEWSSIGPAYLRVQRTSVGVLSMAVGVTSVTSRWINVSCPCCDRCYSRLARMFWTRLLLFLGLMFGVPALLCGGLPVVLMEVVGVPRGPALGSVVSYGALATFAAWIAMPLIVGAYTRRATKRALPADIDARLRELSGIKSWGWLKAITVMRKVPSGEGVVELRGSRW